MENKKEYVIMYEPAPPIIATLSSILLEIEGIKSFYNDCDEERKLEIINWFISIHESISDIISIYKPNASIEIIARHSICCSCGKIKHNNELVQYDDYRYIYVPQCKDCREKGRKFRDRFIILYLSKLLAKLIEMYDMYEAFNAKSRSISVVRSGS